MISAAGIRRAPLADPADVLRDIAHELRQPLSAIESIAYYLALVVPPGDQRAQEQLARIRQLVEQSGWILTSGLGLAGCMPAPEPALVDVEELITRAVSSQTARPAILLALAGGLPPVRLDPAQGRRLVETLLMLARPLAPHGGATLATTACAAGGVEIALTAPGHTSVSACGPGAALGLENARRIVEGHGGTLQIDAPPETGLSVRVMLP
jgi:signal transduction histidine kinase